MRAMVLAAGMGSRLRPLTLHRPKALVEVGGHTMLEITLRRLANFGIREIVVNAHHHAEMIVDYLAENDFFGLSIEVSIEPELLDTGGGLQKAAPMLLAGGYDGPILVHNVDILSNVDFEAMRAAHERSGAWATVAVKPRPSKRQLLFDAQDALCGWQQADGSVQWARQAEATTPLAFCGLHIVAPQLIASLTEQNAFSIIPAYLKLASEGKQVMAYRADASYWRDLGKPESVAAAAQDLATVPGLSPFAE
jgi:NDP-sugar pyrophosphorylase family protein